MKITLEVPDPRPITGWTTDYDMESAVFSDTIVEALSELASRRAVPERFILSKRMGLVLEFRLDDEDGECSGGNLYADVHRG